jgi:1,2-dihydroxy-3-keto-5-methylthiopentene dioxygenase
MAWISTHDRDGQELASDAAAGLAPAKLAELGIEFGRWELADRAVSSLPQLTYARELNALQRRYGALRTDRVRWRHGQTHADVAKTWPEPSDEHVHEEREVRVVLEGSVRFIVRAPALGGYASVRCEAGDWIALPAGVAHACQPAAGRAADMLRLFDGPRGSVARRTAVALPPRLRERAGRASSIAMRLAA